MSASLFSQMIKRPGPRKPGVLPAQEIQALIRNGKIRSRFGLEISDDQVQPASIDLRLGDKAYRVLASFLPSGNSLIGPKIKELQLEEIDLSRPAVLSPNNVFIAPLVEHLALPPDMGGKANPKSTTGRLDIFTRLMADGQPTFEVVPKGYTGDLYVEIVPRTFSIVVQAGTKLNQLRLFRGEPTSDDEQLRKMAQKRQLIFDENGSKAVIREGLRLSIDLRGEGEREGIVAYKAKKAPTTPIDLSKVAEYDVETFWEPQRGRDLKSGLVLAPGDFYLLASRERVSVPPDYSAEMVSYDPSIGEFTVHYAGFFDPGFGFGRDGEIQGTTAVLEVRAHEVPILLEDAREVGRLLYLKMAEIPDRVYGEQIGSSYQQQGLALSKQFKKMPALEPAFPLFNTATL